MMNTLERRIALVTGPLAVALWVVGLVLAQAVPSKIPSHPTDAQLLAWIKANESAITAGGFLFVVGCVAFLCFAAMLRSRIAAAEGERQTFASLVFGAAAVMTALGACMQGDMAAAIDANDISAATAGALHNFGDLFFIGVEVACSALLLGTALAAFRTGVLPRWWAAVAALVGVVALVGPIGWIAVIAGLPIWTLGTTIFLARTPRAATVRAAAVATA
jgi:hypothetical protein